MIAEAQAGRATAGNKGLNPLRSTGLLSLAIAQFEGAGDEASRAGIRFHLKTSGATGIAPVQALPTTAAQWCLYNPANSPVSIFIDRLGMWLVSGVAGAGGTVLAAICTAANLPSARPAAVTTAVLQSANGLAAKASKLIVASGVTLLVAPSWGPLAWMNPANTVLGQTQMQADLVPGEIVLAPDTGLALAVISPTGTTPLFAPYGTVREYATDNE